MHAVCQGVGSVGVQQAVLCDCAAADAGLPLYVVAVAMSVLQGMRSIVKHTLHCMARPAAAAAVVAAGTGAVHQRLCEGGPQAVCMPPAQEQPLAGRDGAAAAHLLLTLAQGAVATP